MELDIEEALRYAGVPAPAPEGLRREMEDVAADVTARFRPRWRWSTRRRGRCCRS